MVNGDAVAEGQTRERADEPPLIVALLGTAPFWRTVIAQALEVERAANTTEKWVLQDVES